MHSLEGYFKINSKNFKVITAKEVYILANIQDQKFSSIEYHDNGIAIVAKTSPTTTSKIYLRNEDVVNLLNRLLNFYTPQASSSTVYDSVNDDDDDTIYDAIY